MFSIHTVKKLVERATDTHIYRALPRGMDPVADIKVWLPNFRAEVIFDVGANVGQSAIEYLASFPQARIYCFEPVKATFQALRANLPDDGRVSCFRLALGAAEGAATMVVEGTSDMFHLVRGRDTGNQSATAKTEDVDLITLDQFCDKHEISRISFLKIDTEGGDLDVLKGAQHMLMQQLIDLVQVEAGMNPANRDHVPFEILKSYLESSMYYLFGVYEQVNEWPSGAPNLRRTNSIFVSQRTIEENRH